VGTLAIMCGWGKGGSSAGIKGAQGYEKKREDNLTTCCGIVWGEPLTEKGGNLMVQKRSGRRKARQNMESTGQASAGSN